jgi:hypothetical protein
MERRLADLAEQARRDREAVRALTDAVAAAERDRAKLEAKATQLAARCRDLTRQHAEEEALNTALSDNLRALRELDVRTIVDASPPCPDTSCVYVCVCGWVCVGVGVGGCGWVGGCQAEKERAMADLQEQLRDVLLHMDTQRQVEASPRRDEIAAGQLVVAPAPDPPPGPSNRGGRRRR